MKQTVIFDLDGTLLDTIGDLAGAGNHVCRLHGWPEYSKEQFAKLVGHGIPNLVHRFTPEDYQTPEMEAQCLKEFSAYYEKHCTDETAPYFGIPELLERLKADGVQLAVYSNKAHEFSCRIVEELLPPVFALVRGKQDGIPVKPNPEGARLLLEALGADSAQTLFVGDSSVDIKTAHNAGLPVCAVSWGFRPRESLVEAGADSIADTAEELAQAIEAWRKQLPAE